MRENLFNILAPVLVVLLNILTLCDIIMFRKDISGLKKLLWGVIIWIFPVLGVVVYYFSKFLIMRR
ncbi:MAG: PLDc N-terminal domain-containing protein [Bacteroidaceae bacterium]|nr:PLDc N-terminal domain-containing protein [Bacteroidaceae bacterium]